MRPHTLLLLCVLAALAALAAAKRIGTVEVDHGETGCQTPDAGPYIRKTVAHRKELEARRKAKKATARKATKKTAKKPTKKTGARRAKSSR